MAKNNAEYQAELRERRAKLKLKRREYWATDAHHKALKKKLEELQSK